MQISHTPGEKNFNGFYHAILTEAFNTMPSVSFRGWKDINTGGCFIFVKDIDYDEVAHTPKFDDQGKDTKRDTSLKTIFKNMNIDYPITPDGENKLGTEHISNKELCRHIVWVTKIFNENGYTFNHDDEEYERIKQEAGIL